MVQKSRGGNKCRSVVSGKRKRGEMKHLKKDNYKKKTEKKIECCVCYEEVLDRTDNVIMCGTSKHTLCGPCKMKMLETGSDCPMCRSHPIPKPKSQEHDIRVTKRNEQEKKISKKIKVIGIESFNGIYEEVGKDKNKMSIYKHLLRNYYIYRSNKYSDWVLNDHYDTNNKLIFGWCSGKFMGTNAWYLVGKDGGWDMMYAGIIKLS